MKRSVAIPCSTGVSLFRGLYARVARDLRLDESYVSRVARGERRSEVAEVAIDREFNKVLALIRNGPVRSVKNQGRKCDKNAQMKRRLRSRNAQRE